MARNDYHVIVYKILAYLYYCLKNGERPDREHINEMMDAAGIGQDYSDYIFCNLIDNELIQGATKIPMVGHCFPGIKTDSGFTITPKGIEYLQSNSMMTKAAGFLKAIGEIAPWLNL